MEKINVQFKVGINFNATDHFVKQFYDRFDFDLNELGSHMHHSKIIEHRPNQGVRDVILKSKEKRKPCVYMYIKKLNIVLVIEQNDKNINFDMLRTCYSYNNSWLQHRVQKYGWEKISAKNMTDFYKKQLLTTIGIKL